MPINLEQPLINSNLDSYLGEAVTGAGPNVPRMSMWRRSWGPSREEPWQCYFCRVRLFPSEERTKSAEADLWETDFSHHLSFVPAMNLNRLKPYHTILMIYFTVTLECPQSWGLPQTLLNQIPLTQSDLVPRPALSPSLCPFKARAGDQNGVPQPLPPPP